MAAPRISAKTDGVGRNPDEPRLFDPDDQIINTKTLALMTGRSEFVLLGACPSNRIFGGSIQYAVNVIDQ